MEDVWDLERCGAISALLDNYYENSYQISCKDLTILKKLQLKKMRTEICYTEQCLKFLYNLI